jgi:hypothetical protein
MFPNSQMINVNRKMPDSVVDYLSVPFCYVCRRNLEYRSKELMKKLTEAGLGSRPIVWVAHSMGGLLVKSMLTKGNFQLQSQI